MGKNLTPKIVLIIVLVLVAGWTVYPPNKTLKPGPDLGGGTSLIYAIDTQGLEESEKKDLSQRMITVLRRRIDPANIQNLIWKPQGSTRFEIQMPLASAGTRLKRQNFEKAKKELLDENISLTKIMRSLKKPAAERAADFNDFTLGDPNRLTILETLATAYDERKELQSQRDNLLAELESAEKEMPSAGIDPNEVKLNVGGWMKLDVNDLAESLRDFSDSNENIELLSKYVDKYSEWAEVVGQLTEPETGKNDQYENAKKSLDKLNLSEDQIQNVLDMKADSQNRSEAIEKLKTEFRERAEKIDAVVKAFDDYGPSGIELDDPKDLQRMLKGAGILEFRILPTIDQPDADTDEMARQVELLKTKGPKFASNASRGKYVWCEIENLTEWKLSTSVVGQFGEKYFVLASNQTNEILLHSPEGQRSWKLERSFPTTDEVGARAIGFALNEKGGIMFGKLTSQNIDRPLCILLDGLAISAPSINERIGAEGIIKGSFTQTDVFDMVNKLNAGSLPARLIEQPISVKTIGPSIGADNRDQGIKAGLIGLCLVVLCMLVYYTLAGSIADIALLMNLLLVLAIMALVRATFTLPGIAGIILTIGMSVDANVLIFERIREEQQKGSSLRIAIRNGYQRAFRTILDANITTFITAAILFWVASEEIKGFAIVLMLGIASSMFTALFVTRVIFDFLLNKRIIKEHLIMLNLIGTPKVNWMASRPIFFGISTVLIIAGIFVFVTRDDSTNNKYGIEFTAGTSAQINLKDNVTLTRQDVQDRIRKMGTDPNNPNPALATASVYSIGKPSQETAEGEKIHKQYEINTTETNKTVTTVTFREPAQHTIEAVTSAIKTGEENFGERLSNLLVTQPSSTGSFVVTTSQMNRTLVRNVLTTAFADANVFADVNVGEPQVDEVVNNAILKSFGDELEIQRNLGPTITSEEKITEEIVDSYPELAEFMAGIKIICETERAATAEEIRGRLADLQYKPDMQNLTRYSHKILNKDLSEMEPNKPVNSFAYISVEPEAGFRELTEDEWRRFVENERTKVLAATRLETSLRRVTQIDPSVGAESKQRALIAIILSLFAIVTYIWVRFGNVRYGLAAIAALVHDVCITLGAITACTYIAGTAIGETLLIGDFKINLAIIAALLTIIGYSLNDTIVVFDRIRENRRKDQLNPQIINDSINQTISRTIMTSFTTFIVVLIMYIFGGQGLRGFTFAIGLGIIVGTYSSIAIAAPALLLGAKTVSEKERKGKRAKNQKNRRK
jgi:SecD/SecF fusion protein